MTETRDRKRCIHYYDAKRQRKKEQERDDGLVGTTGYEIQGCFDCNGYKTKEECPKVLTEEMLK